MLKVVRYQPPKIQSSHLKPQGTSQDKFHDQIIVRKNNNKNRHQLIFMQGTLSRNSMLKLNFLFVCLFVCSFFRLFLYLFIHFLVRRKQVIYLLGILWLVYPWCFWLRLFLSDCHLAQVNQFVIMRLLSVVFYLSTLLSAHCWTQIFGYYRIRNLELHYNIVKLKWTTCFQK